MKKFLSIILIIAMVVSFASCINTKDNDEEKVTSYSKISYTDFNNFAGEKGYSSTENVDNSKLKFDKSFSIEADDGFNLIFYEVENKDMAYQYFNLIVLTYETFVSDYSTLEKNDTFGYYMLKDDDSILYISYVDNTIMYSVITNQNKDDRVSAFNKLKDFVTFVQYPFKDAEAFIK